MTSARQYVLNPRRGFTLVELMVVIVIIAILSGLSLAGLAIARTHSKADASRFMVRKLSDAITEHYETYEDLRLAGTSLADVRLRMREELPDSWADVPDALVPSMSGVARAYMAYKKQLPAPSHQYGSAECLYMIITQSGLFPDFLQGVNPDRVGDIDQDGKREFWDGWGRPIAFCRWPAGFSYPLSQIQIPDPATHHDPVDIDLSDATAFAMVPLIFSPGPDEASNDPLSSGASGYGVVLSGTAGWPTSAITGITCPSTPTTYQFSGGLAGSPDPDNPNAYRDNITNHDLIAE